MKKIIAILLLGASLFALAYVYFEKKQVDFDYYELYHAIPSTFPVAFESTNWEKQFSKIDTFTYGKSFLEQNWYLGAKSNIELTYNLLNLNLNENNEKENLLLVAFGNNGNQGVGILTVTKISTSITEFIDDLEKKNIVYEMYAFEHAKIYKLSDFNNTHDVYFAIKNGLLLFSFESSFVEEALISLSNEEHDWPKPRTMDDGDISLYFNPKQIDYLTNYIFKPKFIDNSKVLKQLMGKSILSLKLYENEILFFGNTAYNDESKLDKLKSKKITGNSSLALLPNNVSIYHSINFMDTLYHTSDYVKNSFYDGITNTITQFYINTYDEEIESKKGFVFNVVDEKEFQILIREIDNAAALYETFDNKSIYKANIGAELSEYLWLSKPINDTVYYVFIEDFLILSNTLHVVHSCIRKFENNALLANNEDFLEFSSSLPSQSNVDVYVNVKEMITYLSKVTQDFTIFNSYSKLGLQLSNRGEQIYTQGKLSISNMSEHEVVSKTIWQTNLDKRSQTKVFPVIDFYTNSKELIVQDEDNTIYLLNKSGDIIFKASLKGKIQGIVYQVDYYKNDKLQYVFNTEEHLYIIDRKGNLVDGFPIQLPAKSSSALYKAQYEENNKVRYFVPCENGHIYAYEKKGKPLSGWSPLKNTGQLNYPLNRVVVNGNDYLFFVNNKGVFRAVDRKGNDRFPPVETACLNPFIYTNDAFISAYKGVIYKIDLKGSLSTKTILDESYTHFIFAHSIIENKDAYAFANNNTFKYQLSKWKNLCSFTVDEPIREIDSIVINNKLWFIIYTKNKAYMIDEIGNVHPEFPIETKSNITVTKLIEGKQDVIIYSTDKTVITKEINWTN